MSQPVSVLIVEDEMIIAAKISLHLEQMGYGIAGILPRGEEAVLHCRKSPPDLILLDVQLKGNIDGIETATILEREGIHLPTIYLTANTDPDTFERARRTRPHAFLGKPYKKADLHRAISLAVQLRADPTAGAPAPQPVSMEEPYLLSDRIFVRHKDQMIKLFLRDILYVQAERAYCHIKTVKTDYMLSIALGKLAEQLPTGNFFRVHRSYLVNMHHIDAVAEGYLVIGETAIPVSRDNREELAKRVNLVR
ncbi:DNA-binding response regulator [Lewinellaceae bacterium SD302]|nr:DNA-binding response regulator [Lewinellaceae bacterium SD302]